MGERRFVVKFVLDVLELATKQIGADSSDFFWVLIDTKTNKIIGWDGGAPEDQLLGRDWSWVPNLLNDIAEGKYPL